LRAAFYELVASAPTSVPTAAPTAPPATAPPEPTAPPATAPPEPTATQTVTLTATVFHGGNIRPQPRIENTPNLPQIHAGEVVTLLEKTANGNWYRVVAPEGTGWVSVTLLRIDANVVNQVPIMGQATPPTPGTAPSGLMATVSHGGHVRETPVTGRPVDEVNAGETVTLLAKTADGAWYRLTDVRGKTGWVSVTLLQIDPAVAKQVPVAR
jgi:SH3-like domain-containing protein